MAFIDPSWLSEIAGAFSRLRGGGAGNAGGGWRLAGGAAEPRSMVAIRECLYRLVDHEPLGSAFLLSLMGFQYGWECRRRNWTGGLQGILEREVNRGRFYLLSFEPPAVGSGSFPLATLFEDSLGDWHMLETVQPLDETLCTALALSAQALLERRGDPARFDDHGDFLVPGGHCIVQRHNTERLKKNLPRKVMHDPRLCTHCMRCITACSEMRAVTWRGENVLLGPMEDYCTDCGLCRKRCSYLRAEPKEDLARTLDPDRRIDEGGGGVTLYGDVAAACGRILAGWEKEPPAWLPFRVCTVLELPSEFAGAVPVRRQTLIEMKAGQGGGSAVPAMATEIAGTGDESPRIVVRRRHRAVLFLQTRDGLVEWDMAREAMSLGVELEAIALAADGGMSFPTHETARFFHRLGRFRWASPLDIWKNREADLFLSPFAGQVPPDLQQAVLEDTGKLASLWFPHILQALPVTRNPLLTQLGGRLAEIFARHPQLMAVESETARELLRDIPRNHALIHARYRHMSISSGHSACPSCAEVQVLAVPVTMGIAMSLARGEVPGVSFTCETGCMSETLNKVNEVAQKVPGGRTVFGGGFAFGEAIAMAQDRAVRMGHLPRGRRYVVSQGGDGGSVIGLPAFLNALRQQAFLIHQRHANVLHFINITDTQVYSNTGGESSASSPPGLGTLTTPIGRFLMGNQKIQWNLINLASEFPGILVGAGHSGDRVAMQEFWHLADQLGQSAIRWDVTPCPETGKFFGEDPDDLAEVMAHAGMLPQVVFVGRFRKRVAPFHPEDRRKPRSEWRREPKPVQYWLQRDPRYRGLFRRNPRSGSLEPRNAVAHFLMVQLESYRDQLNWQIDLETRIVRQAEEWVASLFQELKGMWNHHCYQLEEFRYAMLFNSLGELKPEYAAGLEHEMVRRVLGWEPLSRYAARRDEVLSGEEGRIDQVLRQLEQLEGLEARVLETRSAENGRLQEAAGRVDRLGESFREALEELKRLLADASPSDPLEQELFACAAPGESPPTAQAVRREALFRLLNRILEERALAGQVELQQYRLAQQLKKEFLECGGVVRTREAAGAAADRARLREIIGAVGPFALGVASLAGDRGIAINRVFAQFFTARGAWAGMAWQFGSSKRGTPVLSATFVDAKPLHRKDAMHSFPMAVLIVTNYDEMKHNPDLFFGRLQPGGALIVNSRKGPDVLWEDLVGRVPESRGQAVKELRRRLGRGRNGQFEAGVSDASDRGTPGGQNPWRARDVLEEASRLLWDKPVGRLNDKERAVARRSAAMAAVKLVSVDMEGIMAKVAGSSRVVSNLVAVGPVFETLREMGFPFEWDRDMGTLTQGFPEAVRKKKELMDWYRTAMAQAVSEARTFAPYPVSRETPFGPVPPVSDSAVPAPLGDTPVSAIPPSGFKWVQDPGEHLMIMGGTLAGMVMSQIATAESPLFYVGFPITPAGNPFYFMAEAFANGHPYIVVDEVNPSEKVAAEKLLGVARTGGFLPVTFTASQGWRLFTEVIPQFVGARLEGIFVITKRALAAPNLNIEESHTDFMSFRDDGGIMLAPKDIQEYVPSLYLARLLTHFAKLPVILSVGGITDTHKIGLTRVPPDTRVRDWLRGTLRGFDYLEGKLTNRDGDLVVHGPSGTSAVYQETQSELEKAHQAFTRVLPYALRAVWELTGVWLGEIEVSRQGAGIPSGAAHGFSEEVMAGTGAPGPGMVDGAVGQGEAPPLETLFILQGSLLPNAVEALHELESDGWTGMACLSIRCMNPFPEDALIPWLAAAKRVVVMDRSNSFGSIPPLASRVFTSFARLASTGPRCVVKPLRTLVGGLGGREVTVDQMKEVLLSTHLLFNAPQEWETQFIVRQLEEDETLKALLAEAAALDVRNTNRHARVPRHLRSMVEEELEYQEQLKRLKLLLAEKDTARFLQTHHQVEFIGSREVLQESVLRRQIVLRLEIALARHAAGEGFGNWRHAVTLLRYSHEREDLERGRALMEPAVEAGAVPHRLAVHLLGPLGLLPTEMGRPRLTGGPKTGSPTAVDETLQKEIVTGVDADESVEPVIFDMEEGRRIRRCLRELVVLNGEKPLFFNPEDYEHELLKRMQSEPLSPLHEASARLSPSAADALAWNYRCCYRDVIDETLQREILVRHHAPELAELFEGDGMKRLEELARRLRGLLAEEGKAVSDSELAAEIEDYLKGRCFPNYPGPPALYLDYFRSWVLPHLLAAGEESDVPIPGGGK